MRIIVYLVFKGTKSIFELILVLTATLNAPPMKETVELQLILAIISNMGFSKPLKSFLK